VLEPNGPAFEGVVDAFGQDILHEGKVDRIKLGAVVFNDNEALQRLNSLVHPAVQSEIAQRCAELLEMDHKAALIEAALHGEDGTLRRYLSKLHLAAPRQAAKLLREIAHDNPHLANDLRQFLRHK